MSATILLCALTLPPAAPADPPDARLLTVGTTRFRIPDRAVVSWSADGKYLAVVEHGVALTLLDAETGSIVRRFAGGFWEGSFALPGGDKLIHLDNDTVRVFDARTSAELETTRLKLGTFESASLLPDGTRYLITSVADTAFAEVRDRTRPDRNLRISAGAVRGDRFTTPDGKWVLFSAGNGSYLRLDVAAEKVADFRVPLAVGSPVVLHPDGKHLYLERDGSLVRADLTTGKEVARRKFAGVGLQHVAVSPDGKELYAGPEKAGDAIRILDAATLEDLRPLAKVGWSGWTMKAVSPDGRWLGFRDGNVYRVIDAKTGRDRVPEALAGHRAGVRQVVTDSTGKRIVSVDRLGHVRITDSATGKELAAFAPPQVLTSSGSGTFFSPDGNVVVIQAVPTGTVSGWDVRAKEATELVKLPERATVLGFSADTTLWLTVQPDPQKGGRSQLQELDLRTGKPARAFELPDQFAAPTHITADGSVVVSLSRGLNNGVVVWRPAEGKTITTFDRNDPLGPGGGHWLAFDRSVSTLSPDGRFLAFTRETGYALDVIDLETKKRHTPLRLGGPPAPGKPEVIVTALAFTPDGKRLAVGLSDGTVRFWDPSTGKEEFRADLGVRGVTALAFAPGGKLVVGGADTTVTVWDVAALAKKLGK